MQSNIIYGTYPLQGAALNATVQQAVEAGFRAFLSSLRNSVARIGLDYVGTVLLHFPASDENVVRLIQRLVLAVDEGLVRSIGVSNFSPSQMRQTAAVSPIPLRINQIEFHPLIDGTQLIGSSIDTGIALQAFSPLARGAVFLTSNGGQILHEIAQANDKTAAQMVLRWITQQGLSVVTHTSRPSHTTANLARRFRPDTRRFSAHSDPCRP